MVIFHCYVSSPEGIQIHAYNSFNRLPGRYESTKRPNPVSKTKNPHKNLTGPVVGEVHIALVKWVFTNCKPKTMQVTWQSTVGGVG